ncbi:DUF305 domain-containing protein [Streptomyces sp. NPDC050485]|uniref:DUF305 domain-containing protein n=1 Tax=Streptomyces sp. NPDC050485 TaxID=3365617 RepID=UPI0037A8C4A5
MSAAHASLSSAARHRRLAAAGTVAALALTLAACGSSDNAKSDGAAMSGMNHGSTGTPASGGTFNNADVAFAQQMIPHHQQAIEMAKLADGRAADPEVKDLATAIERAQDPEITTMKGWLKSWGKPLPSAPMGAMPGMNHGSSGSSGTAGMMSDRDMSDLKAVTGKDFDKKFAQLMIGHHQGAVAMARNEQRSGANTDAKKLAGDVITAQTAEIEKMNQIIDRL